MSAPFRTAPRPRTLDGLRLGLLANGKEGAGPFLAELARLLSARFHLKGLARADKGRFSLPAPEDLLRDLARRADVVVTATGE